MADELPAKPFRKRGRGYIYEPEEGGRGLGVQLRAERIRRHSGGVNIEIIIESTLPPNPGHVHYGALNLLATTSKASLAKVLQARANIPGLDWAGLIEEFCVAVLRAERTGPPAQSFGLKPVDMRPAYLLPPLLLEEGPHVLFGDGAIGKGWLAIGLTQAVAAGVPFAGMEPKLVGPTLYCDWEDHFGIWNARAWRIAEGLGLKMPATGARYRHSRKGGPLKDQVDQVLDLIEEHGSILTVIDSVGLASGAGGEHQSYEDRALELFEALEDVPGAILLIDHVSAEAAGGKKLAGKSYGSIYKRNLARLQWEVIQRQRVGEQHFSLGLFHAKGNHSERLAPIGLLLEFDPSGAVRISPEGVRDTPEFMSKLSVPDRLREALLSGALSSKELAGALDAPETTVRSWVARYKDIVVRLVDGRIGLSSFNQMEFDGDEQAEDIPF